MRPASIGSSALGGGETTGARGEASYDAHVTHVDLLLSARPTLHLALCHAGVPLVNEVRVRCRAGGEPAERIEGASLVFELSPDLGPPVVRSLPVLRPGEWIELGPVAFAPPWERLRAVGEAERIALEATR